MVRRAISNIGKILVQQQTEIVYIAAVLIVIGLVTKFFGLLFNSVAVGYLGPDSYNTFVFASNIPELISQIILFGTISASVLPVLSTVLEKKGQARLTRVFSSLINVSLIVFSIISLLIAFSAQWIMPWFIEQVIKPTTPVSPAEMSELVSMMRVLMIPQVILGISVYLSTALNLFERFIVPQLAPLFYNLGRIAAIYIFLPFLGHSPWVLVWGTLLGAIVHLLIQLPLIHYIGLKYKPVIDTDDYYIRRIGIVALPRVVAMSAEQVSIAVDRVIAFSLVGNSLAIYNLAILVVSVPLNIFGVSFATASFPVLAKSFVKNDRIVASRIFLKILNQILFFSVPIAVLLLVLRVPIARLTFGMFGSEVRFLETYSIAWVILFFAPGVVFESLRSFLYRTFYATHDTIRPLIVSVFVMVSGVITGILFTNYLSHFSHFSISELTWDISYFTERQAGVSGVGGLALSSSVIFTIEAIVLIYWLNRRYLHMDKMDFVAPITKKLLAGLAMFVFTYLTYKIWASLETNERTIPLVILTMTTTASSLMVYIASSGLLKIEEVEVYLQFLAKHPNWKSIKSMFRRFRSFDPIPQEI